jgi:8-oxo-dGTP pyrophosphatase MutT (NUDIX family)
MDYIHWLRSQIGSRKTILAYATAIIHDDRGRVLFQRRRDFREAWWGLPGGALELGETFGQCAKREVLEETGLQIEPHKLIGLYASPEWDVTYPNGDEVQQFTLALDCHIAAGALKANNEEIDEQKFFELSDPPDRCPCWYAAMLRDWARAGSVAYFDAPIVGSPLNGYMQNLRAVVGTQPLLVMGAGAILFDDRGRVLLGQRGDNQLWGLPAGQMELGETPAGTVVRETFEELGLHIRPTQLVGVFAGPGGYHRYPDGNQVYIAGARFRAEIVGGELKPDGYETLAADWFDVNDLPPMVERHRRAIRIALEHPEGGQFL